MTDETSQELRNYLLEQQQQLFNALHKSATGQVAEFFGVDDYGDDDAKPLLVSDPDAIREKSVVHWKVGIGMKAMYDPEKREWSVETDEKLREDNKYIAGLYADWADAVATILNYDDKELRANYEEALRTKHEEAFGSKSD